MAIDPMEAARAPHARRADRLIRDRFRAVRAQAITGDLAGAVATLVGLQHGLLAPDGSGVLGDARASFYRDAWRHTPFDPAAHDPALIHPVAEGAAAARTAPIDGRDSGAELARLVDRARSHLAIAASGDPASRPAAVATWQQQHEPTLRAWAARSISDGQVRLRAVVDELRLRPEYRGRRSGLPT